MKMIVAGQNSKTRSRDFPISKVVIMDLDQEKLEQTVLALLYLTSFKDKFGMRAWKGHDWQVMNSLHEKGYISNPASKAKSVALTEEGARLSQGLFEKCFAMK
jgi:hypothetical protein